MFILSGFLHGVLWDRLCGQHGNGVLLGPDSEEYDEYDKLMAMTWWGWNIWEFIIIIDRAGLLMWCFGDETGKKKEFLLLYIVLGFPLFLVVAFLILQLFILLCTMVRRI